MPPLCWNLHVQPCRQTDLNRMMGITRLRWWETMKISDWNRTQFSRFRSGEQTEKVKKKKRYQNKTEIYVRISRCYSVEKNIVKSIETDGVSEWAHRKKLHVHKQKKNERDGRRPIPRWIWSNGRDAGYRVNQKKDRAVQTDRKGRSVSHNDNNPVVPTSDVNWLSSIGTVMLFFFIEIQSPIRVVPLAIAILDIITRWTYGSRRM